MVKGRGSATPDRMVAPGDGNGGVTPEVTEDTGLSDQALRQEDQKAEAQAPDTAQETQGGVEQRESKPQRVKYRGIGTIRRITESEWSEAGVNDMETVEWNRQNKWTLPVGGQGGLSDNALNLIKDESEFSVE